MTAEDVLEILQRGASEIPEIAVEKEALEVNSMHTAITMKANTVEQLQREFQKRKEQRNSLLEGPLPHYEDIIAVQSTMNNIVMKIKNECFDIAVLATKCANVYEEKVNKLQQDHAEKEDQIQMLQKSNRVKQEKIEELEDEVTYGVSIPFDPKLFLCMLYHRQLEKQDAPPEKAADLAKAMEEADVKWDTLKHPGQVKQLYLNKAMEEGWVQQEDGHYRLAPHLQQITDTVLALQ